MLKYAIILPLVFLAGFVDALAGGGGLISLPAYMLAGLPVHNALATNKLSSTMGTTLTTIKYARNGFIPWRSVFASILSAFAGSAIGARLALIINDFYFKIVMLVILPFIAFYVLKDKNLAKEREPYPIKKTVVICAAIALVVGLYDGFYGPGTGTFLILLFTGVAHMSLTQANGAAKAINLSTDIASFTVYLISGHVIFLTGIIAGCFNIAGNYLGARCFTKGGAKFARPVIIIVLAIFFIKIILELCGFNWTL